MMLEGPLEKIKLLFSRKFREKMDEEKSKKWYDEMSLMNQMYRIVLFEVLKNLPQLIDTMERYKSLSYIRDRCGEKIIDEKHFYIIQKELLYIKHKLTFILKYSNDGISYEKLDPHLRNMVDQELSFLKGENKNG